MMETFDPAQGMPAFLRAIDAVKDLHVRQTSFKLPMLKDTTVTVSPLTGKDDLRIKTARTDMKTFNRMINEILFEHSVFEGEQINSLDEFEHKITMPDKQILTGLILDASYEELPARDIVCPECETASTHKIKMSEVFSNPDTEIVGWDHDEPVYEKVFVKSFFDDAITVHIKYVTEAARNDILQFMNKDKARANILKKGGILDSTDALLTFIEQLDVLVPSTDGRKKPEVISLRNKHVEIRGFLDNAPLAVHEAIKEFINDTFNKYKVVLKAPVTCPNCGNHFGWEVDPESEFFRVAVFNAG